MSWFPCRCAIFKLPDYHKHISRPPPGVKFPEKVEAGIATCCFHLNVLCYWCCCICFSTVLPRKLIFTLVILGSPKILSTDNLSVFLLILFFLFPNTSNDFFSSCITFKCLYFLLWSLSIPSLKMNLRWSGSFWVCCECC